MKLLVLSLLTVLLAFGFSGGLTADEIEKHVKKGDAIFLDVRDAKEIKELGSVPGYVNIPLAELEKRVSEVPKGKLIITMCNHGVRAAKAVETLQKHGYKTLLSCGLSEYKEKGKKLVYPQ